MARYDQGDDFQAHLQKTGKLIQANTNVQPNVETRDNNQTQNFSRKLQLLLDEIGPNNTKKVLVFWQIMLRAYGAGMKATYGTEPDKHFVALAQSLTKKDMQRVADNVQDLLLHGKTFSPAHEGLRMLSQRPTRHEINVAKDDLHYCPKPTKHLNRVNQYIREFHIAKIKALKTEGFDHYFDKLYINMWREVMIFNADLRTKSQQDAVRESIENSGGNRFDKLVEENLKNGKAFDNPFGKRIAEIMANKKNQPRGHSITDEDIF